MELQMLSFQQHKMISVVQFMSADKNTFDYISGPAALKKDLMQIKEISEEGTVNELTVFNLSDTFIFFMDGDILTGAKQNRVLNTSVLLAPNSKINLPVSCVEQGRWSRNPGNFSGSDYIVPQKLRANKARAVKENLEEHKITRAEQSQVWDDVHAYSVKLHCVSPTMSMNDIFESQKTAFKDLNEIFIPDSHSNGIAVFYGQRLLCADLFNRSDIMAEYFPKIIKSAAIETDLMEEKSSSLSKEEAFFKTLDLYDIIERMDTTRHKSPGAGEEMRFADEKITGFLLGYNKNIIHLTALNFN